MDETRFRETTFPLRIEPVMNFELDLRFFDDLSGLATITSGHFTTLPLFLQTSFCAFSATRVPGFNTFAFCCFAEALVRAEAVMAIAAITFTTKLPLTAKALGGLSSIVGYVIFSVPFGTEGHRTFWPQDTSADNCVSVMNATIKGANSGQMH